MKRQRNRNGIDSQNLSEGPFGGLLIILLSGFLFWGTLLPTHRIMNELKEKLSAGEFQESTRLMWRQALIAWMITKILLWSLYFWFHESQSLLLFSLSSVYLGYAAWWRYSNQTKTAQGD